MENPILIDDSGVPHGTGNFHVMNLAGGQDSKKPRVLTPGSGLSRLPFECARRGYAAQGNEFSYHMLQGCKWVLGPCNCLLLLLSLSSNSNNRSIQQYFEQSKRVHPWLDDLVSGDVM